MAGLQRRRIVADLVISGALRRQLETAQPYADAVGLGVASTLAGPNTTITTALMGVPAEALIAFNHVSVNTGITKVAVGRSGTTLISTNKHAHLDEAEGALISYR